ncbi:MAG TPA: PadR family transcriptional regulator [Acidimicrobiales bacterium]|jgi:DNA-binding PadR family transcriptional regulator|nr:PadR family transcriptional regulator [Acidimicrobiales bacterium]
MLELAILGLLEENDLHGYELRKRLGDLLGLRLAISFGSLYPALGRLEKAGLVKVVSSKPVAATPRSPMSGSLAGELAAFGAQRLAASGAGRVGRGARGKKVYGITDAGRQRLGELLADPDVSDDKVFPLRVALCHNLAPAARIDLFERRRAELSQRAAQPAGPGERRVNTYLRSLLERDRAALAADIAWLDRLVAHERDALDADDDPTL